MSNRLAMPRRRLTRLVNAALALVAASVVAVHLIPRYPSIESRDADLPSSRIAAKLDPWMLADGVVDRLVVEVDWVEGCEPGPKSLEGLRRVLIEHGPAGRRVDIVKSDVIPRAEWQAEDPESCGDPVAPIVAAFAESLVEEGVEHRYALFAPRMPRRPSLFGQSTRWTLEGADGKEVILRGVLVFRDPHEDRRPPWVDLDELERMTLLHEFGHQLGLVSDPRHERLDPHAMHCTRLDCVMAHPTPRVIARNLPRGLIGSFMSDYCSECVAEIHAAQACWREQASADPGWSAKLRSERLASREALRLARVSLPDELLRAADDALERFPGSPSIAPYRTRALLLLGRVDEAIEEAPTSFAGATTDSTHAAWLWGFSRTLMARGQHGVAYSLVRPLLVDEADEYVFEQSCFVALEGLKGCGRFDDASALLTMLLERGKSRFMSVSEPHVRATQVDLLRRAGRLDEAGERLAPLMRTHRTIAIPSAEALARALGEEEKARRLAQERLEQVDPAAPERRRLFMQAVILASLNRNEEAHRVLADGEAIADALSDPSTETQRRITEEWRLKAHVALGDPDEAAACWQSAFGSHRGPCGEEWLDAVRNDAQFADRFDCCRE